MSKLRFTIAFIALIGVSTLLADEGPKRVKDFLAVMDLDVGKGVDKKLSAPLTNVVIDELVKMKKYKVIDRANRDKILSEVGFQMTGCVDSSCTIEAGRILGVGKLVVGRIDKLGGSYVIFLQLLDVATASIDASARESCKCDEVGLLTAAANTARKLMGRSPGAPPPTKPQTTRKKPKGKCSKDMAYIPDGNFCMDVYEYPNKKGLMPKGGVFITDARKICKSLGKRLPKPEEWEISCLGPQKLTYFYSNNYDPSKCNGGKKLKPSGDLPGCSNGYGLYDMVGNVWEWTDDGVSKVQYIMGGSVRDKKKYINCHAKWPASTDWFWGIYAWRVGFRCAKDAE